MEIPSYYSGLLSSDEMDKLKNQSLYSGLLGFGQALAESSAPSLTPRSAMSGVSRGLTAFNQGYQGQVDTALQNMLKGAQVKQMLEKQKQDAQLKELYKTALVPQYQTTAPAVIPQGQTLLDEMNMPTYGVTPEKRAISGYQFDMKSVIPTLQALGRFDLIKDIGESQKTLRQSGIMGDGQAPSPFAPYINARNPAVRQLATQLQTGFERGIIDEETAYKRLDPLAKMEESYVQRIDKQAEGKKPAEGERLSAGFAQRMEFSEEKIKELEDKYAKGEISVPYPTVGMSVAGSLPFVGNYARSKTSTDEQALYRQAQENWVRANLRKESGAAIGADEMDREIQTYFPTAGELSNPQIIAQKSQARQVTMDAMRKNAGVAYEPFNMSKFIKNNNLEPRKK
jgi:hypothetical protein